MTVRRTKRSFLNLTFVHHKLYGFINSVYESA